LIFYLNGLSLNIPGFYPPAAAAREGSMKEIIDRMQQAVNKNSRLYKKLLRLIAGLSGQAEEPEKNAFRLGTSIDDIERSLAMLDSGENIRSEFKSALEELRDISDHLMEQARTKYIVELDRASNESGVPFEGNFPHLRSGFFSIDLDPMRAKAVIWFGPGAEKIETAAVHPDAVCRAVASHLERLSLPLDEELFLNQIYTAYEVSLLKGEQLPGSPIPLSHILVEINFLKQPRQFLADPSKRTFQAYSRTAFSFDLYRLKLRQYNGRKLTLVVATRAQTRRKEDHLWIPANDRGEGTHYTSLYFKKPEGELL
jgi:hypothetical protein